MNGFEHMRKQNFSQIYADGLVVNNVDPQKSRRLQVRVAGIHDDVPDEDLPWAVCGVDAGRGPHEEAAHVAIPRIGALVSVEFQQGDPQNPIYTGGVSSSKTVPALFKVNYPDRSGFLLPNGTYFYVDEVSGDLVIQHQSMTAVVNEAGETTLTCPKLLVDCPDTKFTGLVEIDGHVTVHAGISGEGDVVLDNYSLKLHDHMEQGDGQATSAARPTA